MDYLTTKETCALVHLTRARVEQLLRDATSGFPNPYQPMGPGSNRLWKRSELVAWIETETPTKATLADIGLTRDQGGRQ